MIGRCWVCGKKVETHLEGWTYDHTNQSGTVCAGSGERPQPLFDPRGSLSHGTTESVKSIGGAGYA